MSNYDTIKNRLEYEEAKLAGLTQQTAVSKVLIKSLKTELAKSDPEAVKTNKKDSDGLPLTEVREENGYEVQVFTDGQTSKIVRVKK